MKPEPEVVRMIDQLRTDYVRAQSQFVIVIQELEAELKRMQENERIPQELIDKKDAQIETLIRFNNKIEDLLNGYKLGTLSLRIELMAVDKMLWDAIKSDKPAFNTLMHDLVKIPNRNPL